MQTCLSSSFLPTAAAAAASSSPVTFGLLGGALAGTAGIGSEAMQFLRRARRRPPSAYWIYYLDCQIISIQFRKGNLPPLKQQQQMQQ